MQSLSVVGRIETAEPTPSRAIVKHLIRSLYRLGRTWHDLGEYAAAEVLYKLVNQISEQNPGLKSAEVVLSLHHWAELLGDTGRAVEAEHYYLRTISACLQHLGTEHPVFGLSLRSYGQYLRRMNMRTEASNIETRSRDILANCLLGSAKEEIPV